MAVSKRISQASVRHNPPGKALRSEASEFMPRARAGKRGSSQDAAYACLCNLNFYCRKMGETLRNVEREVGIPKRNASYYRVLVEEACALASQDMLEVMNEGEIDRSAHLGRARQRLEKQLLV